MAQIIVSVQMVLEEKFVYKHDVHPLRAVGTEGTGPVCLHSQTLVSAVNLCNAQNNREIHEENEPKS